MPEPATSRVSPWLYWSLFPFHRLLLRLYFGPITIRGRDHLPAQGPMVLAVKHYSRWDPLIVLLLTKKRLWFMTNANQFVGLQGWFIERLGAFPVEIARPQLSSLRHAVALLQAGERLVIFPEGGIVRNQPLRPLKPGLARLVLQAEAAGGLEIPIVPIALRYEPGAQFGAEVIVQINPPLYSRDHRMADEKATAQALTLSLQESLISGLRAAYPWAS